MNLGEVYLEPLYLHHKRLGGTKTRKEFMTFLNSEKFDVVIRGAV